MGDGANDFNIYSGDADSYYEMIVCGQISTGYPLVGKWSSIGQV